ncbi:MAG: hypothetical protein RR591_07055 [Cetobacterium sp.]|uniref:hypothetical protein n=1 Tax=Cetobacterium sp. TaxID=2071632 RepID=UPI002FC681D5
MSLYLGKIHYWLFNKILWFEELEDKIIQLAIISGLDISTIKDKIDNKYGEKLENKNLEEIIDLNNIHGWLQSRIQSSEGRMAAWIKFFLENAPNSIDNLKKVFEDQGIVAAKIEKEKKQYISASDIYTVMNNYILDGMPCDRVNVISISEDKLVSWERQICVHKEIWEKEGVDVSIFYLLRNSWIESFIKELNPNFKYIEESNGKYKIILNNL